MLGRTIYSTLIDSCVHQYLDHDSLVLEQIPTFISRITRTIDWYLFDIRNYQEHIVRYATINYGAIYKIAPLIWTLIDNSYYRLFKTDSRILINTSYFKSFSFLNTSYLRSFSCSQPRLRGSKRPLLRPIWLCF